MDCEILESIEDKYEVIQQIGSGTYSNVFLLRDCNYNLFAAKQLKILQKMLGFPINSIREISILKDLKCKNIVDLRKIISTSNNIVYLVFDYYKYDLSKLLYGEMNSIITKNHIIYYMKQIINSIKECRDNFIIHRDIKPSNIFITDNNEIKLGDFGLARRVKQGAVHTSHVVTLYYRAPELLLGSKDYSYEVDMWSVGCVLFEMMAKKPLFFTEFKNHNVDIAQMDLIFSICGTPNIKEWQELEKLDKNSLFKNKIPKPNKLKEYLQKNLPICFHGAIDLLLKMLEITPSKRITPDEALQHPFFLDNNISPQSLGLI